MPTLMTDSPASRRFRYFCFFSGVPYSARTRIGPKLPAWTTSPLLGHAEATVSIAITASMSWPPWPPSASAIVIPSSPCAAMSLATSHGYSGECARACAPVARCFSAKRRTDSRNCSCSGVKRKSMVIPRAFPLLGQGGAACAARRGGSISATVPPRRLRRHPSSMRRGKVLFLHHDDPVDRDDAFAFHDQRIDLAFRDRPAADEREARERGDSLRQRTQIAARQSAVAAHRREALHPLDHLLRVLFAHRREPQRVVLVDFRERASRPDEHNRPDDRIVAIADDRLGEARFHFLYQYDAGGGDAR